MFPQGDAHVLSSAPGMRAAPDMSVFARSPTPLPLVYELGGGGPERSRIVCGFLGCDERPYNPLLTRAADGDSSAGGGADGDGGMARHAAEHRGEGVGQRACRDARTCWRACRKLMFVEAIRRYLETLPPSQTGWLAGLRDPVVGQALAALHGEPGAGRGRSNGWRGWSACRARCSRSGSPRWSASRRCSTWRCGACSSRPACWSKAARWRRSPVRSATSRRPRSAARSRSWSARRRPRGGAVTPPPQRRQRPPIGV